MDSLNRPENSIANKSNDNSCSISIHQRVNVHQPISFGSGPFMRLARTLMQLSVSCPAFFRNNFLKENTITCSTSSSTNAPDATPQDLDSPEVSPNDMSHSISLSNAVINPNGSLTFPFELKELSILGRFYGELLSNAKVRHRYPDGNAKTVFPVWNSNVWIDVCNPYLSGQTRIIPLCDSPKQCNCFFALIPLDHGQCSLWVITKRDIQAGEAVKICYYNNTYIFSRQDNCFYYSSLADDLAVKSMRHLGRNQADIFMYDGLHLDSLPAKRTHEGHVIKSNLGHIGEGISVTNGELTKASISKIIKTMNFLFACKLVL